MPPLPRLAVEAIEDLARQLRFAPKHALLRDLARTESLVEDIDPEQDYPEDFIIFRVTGYRQDIASPAMINLVLATIQIHNHQHLSLQP